MVTASSDVNVLTPMLAALNVMVFEVCRVLSTMKAPDKLMAAGGVVMKPDGSSLSWLLCPTLLSNRRRHARRSTDTVVMCDVVPLVMSAVMLSVASSVASESTSMSISMICDAVASVHGTETSCRPRSTRSRRSLRCSVAPPVSRST